MRDLQSYIDEEYRKAPEEAMPLYDGKMIDEVFPHVLRSQLESRLPFDEAACVALGYPAEGVDQLSSVPDSSIFLSQKDALICDKIRLVNGYAIH